ncbi:Peroxisomal fatty acid beta-oxidation multifunctional protein [Platanthera guangdongensis]|uniref:Peroxisomal fatty acid beta-oxidation multifunctional protein n=1 Tax=Platanthera guangdongensis TaxID=2320717 RepID=A0ABR2MI57_9ASPA
MPCDRETRPRWSVGNLTDLGQPAGGDGEGGGRQSGRPRMSSGSAASSSRRSSGSRRSLKSERSPDGRIFVFVMAREQVAMEVGSDGVAIITISNPPVNALATSVIVGLKEKYKEAMKRSDVKAIVLTGELSRGEL